MMLGALETQEDLDLLMERIRSECLGATDDFTEVYVQNGFWSGEPPYHFKMPTDVFLFLQRDNTVACKTIGNLTCEEDLAKLVQETREEIENGPKVKESIIVKRSLPPNVEKKMCGHVCTMSSLKEGCCSCLDKREILDENSYPLYVDGIGWENAGSRGCGYCPYCQY